MSTVGVVLQANLPQDLAAAPASSSEGAEVAAVGVQQASRFVASFSEDVGKGATEQPCSAAAQPHGTAVDMPGLTLGVASKASAPPHSAVRAQAASSASAAAAAQPATPSVSAALIAHQHTLPKLVAVAPNGACTYSFAPSRPATAATSASGAPGAGAVVFPALGLQRPPSGLSSTGRGQQQQREDRPLCLSNSVELSGGSGVHGMRGVHEVPPGSGNLRVVVKLLPEGLVRVDGYKSAALAATAGDYIHLWKALRRPSAPPSAPSTVSAPAPPPPSLDELAARAEGCVPCLNFPLERYTSDPLVLIKLSALSITALEDFLQPRQLGGWVADSVGAADASVVPAAGAKGRRSRAGPESAAKLRRNNTSSYVGVSRVSGSSGWAAGITVNKAREHLGSFRTNVEAAIVRDVGTIWKQLHGHDGAFMLNLPLLGLDKDPELLDKLQEAEDVDELKKVVALWAPANLQDAVEVLQGAHDAGGERAALEGLAAILREVGGRAATTAAQPAAQSAEEASPAAQHGCSGSHPAGSTGSECEQPAHSSLQREGSLGAGGGEGADGSGEAVSGVAEVGALAAEEASGNDDLLDGGRVGGQPQQQGEQPAQPAQQPADSEQPEPRLLQAQQVTDLDEQEQRVQRPADPEQQEQQQVQDPAGAARQPGRQHRRSASLGGAVAANAARCGNLGELGGLDAKDEGAVAPAGGEAAGVNDEEEAQAVVMEDEGSDVVRGDGLQGTHAATGTAEATRAAAAAVAATAHEHGSEARRGVECLQPCVHGARAPDARILRQRGSSQAPAGLAGTAQHAAASVDGPKPADGQVCTRPMDPQQQQQQQGQGCTTATSSGQRQRSATPAGGTLRDEEGERAWLEYATGGGRAQARARSGSVQQQAIAEQEAEGEPQDAGGARRGQERQQQAQQGQRSGREAGRQGTSQEGQQQGRASAPLQQRGQQGGDGGDSDGQDPVKHGPGPAAAGEPPECSHCGRSVVGKKRPVHPVTGAPLCLSCRLVLGKRGELPPLDTGGQPAKRQRMQPRGAAAAVGGRSIAVDKHAEEPVAQPATGPEQQAEQPVGSAPEEAHAHQSQPSAEQAAAEQQADGAGEGPGQGTLQACTHCGATETLRWRQHPSTQATLCNRCHHFMVRHGGQLPLLKTGVRAGQAGQQPDPQQDQQQQQQQQQPAEGRDPEQRAEGDLVPLQQAAGQRACLQCGTTNPGRQWRRHPVTKAEWMCNRCYAKARADAVRAEQDAQQEGAGASAAKRQRATKPQADEAQQDEQGPAKAGQQPQQAQQHKAHISPKQQASLRPTPSRKRGRAAQTEATETVGVPAAEPPKSAAARTSGSARRRQQQGVQAAREEDQQGGAVAAPAASVERAAAAAATGRKRGTPWGAAPLQPGKAVVQPAAKEGQKQAAHTAAGAAGGGATAFQMAQAAARRGRGGGACIWANAEKSALQVEINDLCMKRGCLRMHAGMAAELAGLPEGGLVDLVPAADKGGAKVRVELKSGSMEAQELFRRLAVASGDRLLLQRRKAHGRSKASALLAVTKLGPGEDGAEVVARQQQGGEPTAPVTATAGAAGDQSHAAQQQADGTQHAQRRRRQGDPPDQQREQQAGSQRERHGESQGSLAGSQARLAQHEQEEQSEGARGAAGTEGQGQQRSRQTGTPPPPSQGQHEQERVIMPSPVPQQPTRPGSTSAAAVRMFRLAGNQPAMSSARQTGPDEPPSSTAAPEQEAAAPAPPAQAPYPPRPASAVSPLPVLGSAPGPALLAPAAQAQAPAQAPADPAGWGHWDAQQHAQQAYPPGQPPVAASQAPPAQLHHATSPHVQPQGAHPAVPPPAPAPHSGAPPPALYGGPHAAPPPAAPPKPPLMDRLWSAFFADEAAVAGVGLTFEVLTELTRSFRVERLDEVHDPLAFALHNAMDNQKYEYVVRLLRAFAMAPPPAQD